MRPATPLWLIAHDLRLWRRGLARAVATFSSLRGPALALLALALLHALAWPAAQRATMLADVPAARPALDNLFAFAGVVLLSLGVASTLRRAVEFLFRRRDLDLLLTSPIRPATILAARGVALAIGGGAVGALFWVPFADDAAWLGRPAWLALDLAAIGLALVAAALGAGLALALTAIFGPSRVRLPAMVAQAAIGLTYFIWIGLESLLPETLLARLADPAPGTLLDHAGPLFAPVRGAMGEPLSLAEWLAAALLAFAFSVRAYAAGAMRAVAAAGSLDASPRRERAPARFAFGPGAALRRKERRLLRRNPGLYGLAAMLVVMGAPVGFQLAMDGRAVSPTLCISVIVLFAGQLAGAFAGMVIAEETAPDLLDSAPIGAAGALRGKIAAFAPLVSLVILAPSAALAQMSLGAGLGACAFAYANAAGVTLAATWTQRPEAKAFGRPQQLSPIAAAQMQVVSIAFAAAAALASLGSRAALAPLALAILALLAARPKRPAPALTPE